MSAALALAVSFFVTTTSCISATVTLRLAISFFKAKSSFLIMLESPIAAAMLSMVSSSKGRASLAAMSKATAKRRLVLGL
jgi:hypothetical protein